MRSLFASESFQAKPVSIPIHGPYHAAHLRSSLNVEQILHLKDEKVREALGNLKTKFPVISCTTGTWYTEQEPELLLQAILLEMLTEPILFNKILQGCVQKGKEFQGRECLIIPFGKKLFSKMFVSLLILNRSYQRGESFSNSSRISNRARYNSAITAIRKSTGNQAAKFDRSSSWEMQACNCGNGRKVSRCCKPRKAVGVA